MAGKHRLAAFGKVKAAFTQRSRGHKRGPVRARPAMPVALWAMPAALWRRVRPILRRPWVRRSLIGAGATVAIFGMIFGATWWRLGSGPIEFDMATPWLTASIEDNFGENYKVQVGGTQIERDGGHIRLRLRDITVRDAEGAIAASAPKAEVGFSGKALMTGRVRAERLALVGAELSVRIDQGGEISVFAGSDKRPIATALVPADLDSEPAPDAAPSTAPSSAAPQKSGTENFNALLAWIDSLSKSGLDGHDLVELGLKSGNLTVDDRRNGKRWNFENIDLSLMRPRGGSVIFRVQSAHEDAPWALSAAVSPVRSGRRSISIDARRVLARDLLLALRLDEPIMANVPLSASLRGEILPDGTLQALQGRIVADAGYLTESTDASGLAIDRAEFDLEWNAARRVLLAPFRVVSGGNRFTLYAQIEPPRTRGAPWNAVLQGGTVMLGADSTDGPPLMFRETGIRVRARFDPQTQRLSIEQGDVANADVKVRISGDADFSTGDPFLKFQIAADRMPVHAMKKIWPSFANAKVRSWVNDHVRQGDVESVTIATNAHFSAFRRGGPPVPDDGLSIEIAARNVALQPLETLPPIEGADLLVEVSGRRALVKVAKGTVALASGRKLTVADGRFEVPDCEVLEPPTKTSMRIEGPVPVAAELLELERLREFVNMPFDISSAKGNVSAQTTLAFPMKRDLPPGSSRYWVAADIANFSVEKMVLGQKVEAQNLRITASNQEYEIKGDTKIAGNAATLVYRKTKASDDAEVRIETTLDDNTRGRLGLESGNAIAGPVPIKLTGTIGAPDRDMRLNIDANLTQATIDNLLPGWKKASGRTSRAQFSATVRGKAMRVENLVLDGSGTRVKGGFELDGSGDLVAANFVNFNLSENDRGGSFKAERTQDGALKITMRGDVHDGRNLIKTALSGGRPDPRDKPIDLDLDVKLGTVMGSYGETMRNLDLRFSRRAGQVRTFGINARLGRDTPIVGALGRKPNSASNVIYLETRDAGAFFRFTDTYSKMQGGAMRVAMDTPTAQTAPQDGQIEIAKFAIKGEEKLDRLAGVQPGTNSGVPFDRMQAEFTRSPGRLDVRDGLVNGNIGGTIDGYINYVGDEVHLRGSFVPLSPLNNMFGQLPLLGPLLGGNEGLVGVTYEVVGPNSAPRLNINPLSMIAPGLFRKLFEFRNAPPLDRVYELQKMDAEARDRR